MDFRLQGCINAIAKEYFDSSCDIITRAGGVSDLVRPDEDGEWLEKSLLRDIEVSIKLHHIKKIVLVAHQDCGAYNRHQLNPGQEEIDFHFRDLVAAKVLLEARFSGIQIELVIATLNENNEFVYKEA